MSQRSAGLNIMKFNKGKCQILLGQNDPMQQQGCGVNWRKQTFTGEKLRVLVGQQHTFMG